MTAFAPVLALNTLTCGELALAARLRRETTMTLPEIAARL